MNQLNLFEIQNDTELSVSDEQYEAGDRVKIKKLLDEDLIKLGSEDYYYLKNFSNKKGIVASVEKNTSGTCAYKVEFDRGLFGFFYASDLIRL